MNAPTATECTLTPSQVAELNQHLSTMRHDINNHISLIMAAVELIRCKPEAADRMANTLVNQPVKIAEAMKTFSTQFETTLGLKPR